MGECLLVRAHTRGWPTVAISFHRITEEIDGEDVEVCVLGNCMFHEEKSKGGCSLSGLKLRLAHDRVDEETLKTIKVIEWTEAPAPKKAKITGSRGRRRNPPPLD
ncbi:uncharacterized protein LOC62_03G003527 [Vanrija pseudolonga]|uniref:Uncharacterized protein n=1 Tax=Vanrija pseudolonga TaxID=143232 RepID=A0AAF0Y496_9TREE|nr:hypothetical protein LOC62_03G003527 [Vanrija pseudolonga]